jgi:hypothetical protein
VQEDVIQSLKEMQASEDRQT